MDKNTRDRLRNAGSIEVQFPDRLVTARIVEMDGDELVVEEYGTKRRDTAHVSQVRRIS